MNHCPTLVYIIFYLTEQKLNYKINIYGHLNLFRALNHRALFGWKTTGDVEDLLLNLQVYKKFSFLFQRTKSHTGLEWRWLKDDQTFYFSVNCPFNELSCPGIIIKVLLLVFVSSYLITKVMQDLLENDSVKTV